MSGLIEKLMQVKNLLNDDLSRQILESRIHFTHTVLSANRECDCREGYQHYDSSIIQEIDCKITKSERFLIAGAGREGIRTYEALAHAGYSNIEGFLDNDKKKYGEVIEGVKVYPFSSIISSFHDCYIVVANKQYGEKFFRQILSYGFPKNKVIYSLSGKLTSRFGWEYFDIPKHKKGVREVFLDVGSLDGKDSLNFIKWCDGEYDCIYAIEPSVVSMEMVKNNLIDNNVKFINAAVGEESGELPFYEVVDHPGASGILANKDSQISMVHMVTIDSIVINEKVTFIKFDTEGSEIPAIIGAKETISRNKPVLAISVYHNEDDVVEIPLLVDSIRQDYKFYLRHYSNNSSDLVLYCI